MALNDTPRRRLIALTPSRHSALRAALADQMIDLVTDTGAPADVALCDLTPHGEDERALRAAIQAARQQSHPWPLIYLASLDQAGSKALCELAKRDRLVLPGPNYRAVAGPLRRAVGEMDRAREAALRLEAMAALGMGDGLVTEGPGTTAAHTLLLADPGPGALAAYADFSHRRATRMVMTRPHALACLEAGQADSLLGLAGPNRRPLATLVKLMRRHGVLSSLPIVIMEKTVTPRVHAYWLGIGADAVLSTDDGGMAAALLSRAARTGAGTRHWNTLLDRTVRNDFGDLSRLASPGFFDHCLALRCADPMTRFAVGTLTLEPKSGQSPDLALPEAAVYLSLAMRNTDLLSRVSPHTFLVSLPGTDMAHAEKTMQALSQMIGDLKFGSRDNAVEFSARTRVVTARPGEAPRQLLRRLFAADGEPVPTLTPA